MTHGLAGIALPPLGSHLEDGLRKVAVEEPHHLLDVEAGLCAHCDHVAISKPAQA